MATYFKKETHRLIFLLMIIFIQLIPFDADKLLLCEEKNSELGEHFKYKNISHQRE